MKNINVVGDGPVKAIVLHGWLGSASAWQPYIEALDRGRFSYAFLDYRGYGRRISEPGEYSISEISRDAVSAADALGWNTFNLVGHSMGGKAIQRVLADVPDRVSRMVAITPVPASGVPFDETAWKFFSSAADCPETRAAIIDNTTGNRLSKAWIAKMVDHSLNHSTPQAVASYLLEWAKGDFHRDIEGSCKDIKVIVGEHDPALNADVMRDTFLRWYPRARLEVMANSGHYPMDEAPVALATSVENFLSGQE